MSGVGRRTHHSCDHSQLLLKSRHEPLLACLPRQRQWRANGAKEDLFSVFLPLILHLPHPRESRGSLVNEEGCKNWEEGEQGPPKPTFLFQSGSQN